MPNPQALYTELVGKLQEVQTLESTSSLLSWDQETYMPPRGVELRARQLSMLATMGHAAFTDPRIGELLGELAASDLVCEPYGDVAAVVRETRRSYDRARKLPPELVKEMAATAVMAQQAWTDARGKGDYAIFQPWLEKTLGLKRREAECVGYKGHIYNALLDPFEPDETAENLRGVFAELRGPLVELVGRIVSSGRRTPIEILHRRYPADAQNAFAREAAKQIGFDFDAGRLDVSVHPFNTGIGPGDCRMTTRYDEHYFGDAFFGVLHESGHGLYEQGLPREHWGSPLGQAISLGIHESQSRMWENLVGRSRPFWKFFFPKLQAAFPQAAAGVSPEQWLRAVNHVEPSLIRTESDEVTYNLHIMLRFEIELNLLTGSLSTKDVPAVWNRTTRDYLGITPPNDAQGCLQDIHWSHGAIGYFPTYTLGNLYAAQFYAQAKADIGGLEEAFAAGDFKPLLGWLREKIHRHGKRYSAGELVRRVTGRALVAKPLLDHLARKTKEAYGV
jgi:carboxypeptidase Taq